MAWIAAGGGVLACAALWRSRRAVTDAKERLAAALLAAEGALSQQRTEAQRLRASLDGLGEGIVILDVQERVLDWNAAAAELAGLPKRPGEPRALDATLPWGQLRGALAQLRGAGTQPGPVAFDYVDVESGEGRSLLVAVRSLGASGFVITMRDQSRLKQLESIRRDFVANVSHELKTPLAAIKGFVEPLRDDAEMPEVTRSRFLERISSQSDRLNTLVGDLLTLSRLDETAGGADRFQPCDVAVVARETVRDLTELAERANIRLRIEAPEAPLFVRADREGLRQVVSNLVDNAIKYTPAGGSVSVRLEQTRDHVRLQVADTGIGLALEDQKRVFERFYRVDRARSRDLGGTGLGLSIVKNTVRSFGGDVAVQSAVGRGTVFWVTLPRLPME